MTHTRSGTPTSSIKKATRFALTACTFVLLLSALGASSAAAEVNLCSGAGSAAGQCSEPRGLATDFETGHVYVADRGNNRIDVFNAPDGAFLFAFGWGVDTGANALQTCTTASTCQAGIAGSAAGQLNGPNRIAVDNAPGSANRHDVYVVGTDHRWLHFKADGSFESATGWGVDTGAEELQTCTTGSGCQAGSGGPGQCQLDDHDLSSVPDPISIGPGGNVFVGAFSGLSGEGKDWVVRVEKFSPAGACLGETKGLVTGARIDGLAVDSAEHAYVSLNGSADSLRKYELGSGTQLCNPTPGVEASALALDASDHLFAFQLESGQRNKIITELDPACNIVRRFGYGNEISFNKGLARFSSAEGDIFGSGETGTVPYLKFPPPGPVVVPDSPEATQIGAVKATIRAEVNPEGKATEVHVEYVTQAHFEAEGFNNAVKGTPVSLAAGFDVKGVSLPVGCKAIAEGGCLEPQTTYRYRVIATNADNPGGTGEGSAEGEPFTTPEHFRAAWASEVGTDSARLSAEVDALGIPTSGYFEYVESAGYEADIKNGGDGFAHAIRVPDPQPPASEAELSFGEGDGAIVKSAVLYPLAQGATYRYRFVVVDPLQQQVSEAKAFTTFSPETPGSCPANEAFRTGPAALLPDCRAYEMVSPVDKAGGSIVALGEFTTEQPATVNQAAVSGGRLAYGAYRAFGDAASASWTTQYIAERDPGAGWRSHAITPPKGEAIKNLLQANNEFKAFSADLCEGWLVPFSEPPLAKGAVAGYFNLYRRTDRLCGKEGFEALTSAKPQNQTATEYTLELQGLSADGKLAAFGADGSLVGSGAPANPAHNVQLYLKGPGKAQVFACVLPGGTPSPGACQAGTGSNLFGLDRVGNFTNAVSADGKRVFWTNANEEGRIFVRENPLGKGAECAEASAPCTLDVSRAAEEASGTARSHFWTAAEDGSKALFSTVNEGKGVSDLYEFGVDAKTTTKIAGGFLGFLGASEDASHVYFASSEVLSGGEENGHGEEAVAGKANLYLYEAGAPAVRRFIGTLSSADVNPFPAYKFGSTATAYQPRKHNGRVSADGEHAAFLSTARLTGYDNTDAVSGEADNEAFLYDAASGKLVCASCNPSGGRPEGEDAERGELSFWIAARLPVYENVLYAPKVLSSDGTRLYFEAADALVPRDTNHRIDVYQWEQLGAGGVDGCRASDASYSPAAGGCVSLISSGQSVYDSTFVDADPSGSDVFFNTVSGLVPQDLGLLDIYDARIGGGLPSPPGPPPGCEGDACQSPPEAPNDPTPASASFKGAGNLAKAPASRCAKGKVRKHARCVAKKRAKKRHSNRKRGAER